MKPYLVAVTVLACAPAPAKPPSLPELTELARSGRLAARPTPALLSISGTGPLGVAPGDRDAWIHVPANLRLPAPLFVMLHGANSNASHALDLVLAVADERGVVVLAPASRGATWDVIEDELGPDVVDIDRALAKTFAAIPIDPARVAVGGFSDGASYALFLGIRNGDLFRRIVAFSPGFALSDAAIGHPRIFVSHGTHDSVLPIERCSRSLVPRLERGGYDVTYREFDGPHGVPVDIAREALAWLSG